jgi:NADH-ubiquinone oxidoreductase chain 2
MLFFSLVSLIMCKALINDKLSEDFYHRISAIILLFSGILTFNTIFNIGSLSGIGLYGGLFNITTISQILESFLLIIGSIILISWPKQEELIKEIVNPITLSNQSYASKEKDKSYLYSLVNSILLENYNKISSEGLLSSNIKNKDNCYSILNNNKFLSYSINYSIIVLFSSLGASLLISCSDLISMYLSIELQSFSLYVLSTLYRDSESSTSAGLKYFLLGGLASCLILFGAGLLYAYTGLTNFESIYSLLSIYYIEINNNLIDMIYPFFSKELSVSIFLGLIFIFIGFLIKISAAPFHNWSPDVYDETPTIVTIWLTIIPKISILILLLDLYIHIDIIDQLTLFSKLNTFKLNIDEVIKYLLLITSLFSLIIGSVVGLAQNRIKRLLAYSTISHIGFILLALAIHTKQSIDSFIFYIIQYIITNLNIFLIIIAFSYLINRSINNNGLNNIKDIRYISEFKGQFYSNPLISLSFSICLFSMAGIPPLIGFFSKQYVLYSAIKGGYYFIAFIAIFVSVISASYYLKIIKTFFINVLSNTNKEVINTNINTNTNSNSNNDEILSNFHSFLISTLTLSILFFIFKPTLILNTTQLLSISLFNH